MKLSRTVAYAVRATLQLAKSEGSTPIPCSQLAAEGKMPERFLLQILRSLVTHGLLKSTRGVDGGYSLIKQADQISLLDIIEAIDGPYEADEESLTTITEIPDHKLRDALTEVSDTTRKQLHAIKLTQLLPPPAAATEGDAGVA